MRAKTWMATAILGAAVWSSGIQASWSQTEEHSHSPRGAATHRRGFRLVDPRGQQAKDLTQFRFILPLGDNSGAYYTYADKHYFTPAPAPDDARREAPVPLEFGAFEHYEKLAARLERMANALCLEMHRNYRSEDGFRQTYREAYQLLEGAKFIHDSAHRDDRRALQESATRLDGLFHHLQEHVQHWNLHQQRGPARLSMPARMEELEALIHHLMFDLGVKPSHHEDHDDEEAPPPE